MNINDLPTTHSKPELVDEFLPPRIWKGDSEYVLLTNPTIIATNCYKSTFVDNPTKEACQVVINEFIESRRERYCHLLPPELVWSENAGFADLSAESKIGTFLICSVEGKKEDEFLAGIWRGYIDKIGQYKSIDEAKAACYEHLVRHIASLMGLSNG